MDNLIGIIRDEVRRQLNIVLFGTAGANNEEVENIEEPFPGMPTIENRPVVHPYGFASRARNGCISMHLRGGDHPGNRFVVGHRDSERPSDFQVGEVVLYNQYGQQIRLENGKIRIGSNSSAENLVLGQVFKQMMEDVLDAITSHTHTGNMGFPTSPPLNSSSFTSIKASPVADSAVLSDVSFTEK